MKMQQIIFLFLIQCYNVTLALCNVLCFNNLCTPSYTCMLYFVSSYPEFVEIHSIMQNYNIA